MPDICLIWVWVKIRYPNNWMVNTKLDIHICGPKSVFHLTHIHINHSIWSSESFLHLRHAVETDRIGTDRRKIFHGAQDRKGHQPLLLGWKASRISIRCIQCVLMYIQNVSYIYIYINICINIYIYGYMYTYLDK